MTAQLQWYTQKVTNAFFTDIHFRVHFGRTYHLTLGGQTGYVIYTDQEIKRKAIAAHAMLGDTKMYLKLEGSFFKPVLNIYDYATLVCIGKLTGTGFIINDICYNIRSIKKSIFNKNLPCDIRYEADISYPDMLLRMDINRVNKKWYRTFNMEELRGTVEYQKSIPTELILATFFYLHNTIQALNRD